MAQAMNGIERSGVSNFIPLEGLHDGHQWSSTLTPDSVSRHNQSAAKNCSLPAYVERSNLQDSVNEKRSDDFLVFRKAALLTRPLYQVKRSVVDNVNSFLILLS